MAERRSWIAASSWKQPSAQFFLEIGSNFLGFRSSLWELFAKRVWTTILPSSLSQHQKQMLPSASPSPPAGPTPTTITNGFTFRNKSDRLLYLLYYCIAPSPQELELSVGQRWTVPCCPQLLTVRISCRKRGNFSLYLHLSLPMSAVVLPCPV